MKLGEKVTCPGFAGLSLCGHVPVQSVCPEALGQSWSWGGQGHPFPGSAGNCHLGGRGRGRLKPDPRVSKGFSCAQWLSPPYWARWVPRCWSRTLRVGSKLVPLLVSVHPPPPHWHICSPAAAIDIPGTLQFKLRVKWNRYQSPGSSQVGWNLAIRFPLITLVWGRQLGADQDCTAPGRRRVQVSNTWWNFLLLCSGFFLTAYSFVAANLCLTVFQNSYQVSKLISLSSLVFPWENSVLPSHQFADITVHVKFYLHKILVYQCITISVTLSKFVAF